MIPASFTGTRNSLSTEPRRHSQPPEQRRLNHANLPLMKIYVFFFDVTTNRRIKAACNWSTRDCARSFARDCLREALYLAFVRLHDMPNVCVARACLEWSQKNLFHTSLPPSFLIQFNRETKLSPSSECFVTRAGTPPRCEVDMCIYHPYMSHWNRSPLCEYLWPSLKPWSQEPCGRHGQWLT